MIRYDMNPIDHPETADTSRLEIAMSTNVMSFPKPANLQPVSAAKVHPLHGAFMDLLRTPQAVNPNSPGGKGPAFGPYNMPIYYLSDGVQVHTAGQYINKLRGKRAHTLNALELRCDALGLAVYIAGMVNLTNTQGSASVDYTRGIRVVIYDFDNEKATQTLTASSPEVLAKMLRAALVNTYNRLALNFNLAGMSYESLVLMSTSPRFPHIHLTD